MILKRLLLLMLMLVTVLLGYIFYAYLRKRINPYKSVRHYLLLVLLSLVVVMILVFCFSFLIFYFRGFFFK